MSGGGASVAHSSGVAGGAPTTKSVRGRVAPSQSDIYAYKGKFNQNNILTAAISAIIFTLIMPSGAPIYAVIVGALAGIVFGKLVFGGLGSNIFNPAAVGMLFAKVCFGGQYAPNVETFCFFKS